MIIRSHTHLLLSNDEIRLDHLVHKIHLFFGDERIIRASKLYNEASIGFDLVPLPVRRVVATGLLILITKISVTS